MKLNPSSLLSPSGNERKTLALRRDDLIAINGFDEAYQGWGLEDSDLVIRLLKSGIGHKTARFAAPVLHLWHRENDRSSLESNQTILDEVLQGTRTEARFGIRHTS